MSISFIVMSFFFYWIYLTKYPVCLKLYFIFCFISFILCQSFVHKKLKFDERNFHLIFPQVTKFFGFFLLVLWFPCHLFQFAYKISALKEVDKNERQRSGWKGCKRSGWKGGVNEASGNEMKGGLRCLQRRHSRYVWRQVTNARK